ncbi:O-methyltransferase family 3 protein [Mycena indigotica]|uniref:O-methyltransferase family 3 protein n=1 Tax=Mycena indigotica TaxID=2126181 RepID=A0A8H6T6I1_9AGAR|nr:O-methyltransferase family 3 protein [Mycena indigotica]KAF7311841.1 O-methyltransferase family 3 protein [Mycena indigotica]
MQRSGPGLIIVQSRQASKPTNEEDWTRSDAYHNSFLHEPDAVLDWIVKNSKEKGLPDIAVSAAQGKLLNLLARSINAKRVLEVGTLGGYSTVWLARALPPDGKIITLEINAHHAAVATENLAHADVADKVELILGPALDSLLHLSSEPVPFDFVFIDADKQGNLDYFKQAKRLVRTGGVIIVDNVVRYGRVADPEYSDANVEGVRTLLAGLKGDDEVDATTTGTVGDKGYDGFLYAIRK